MARHKHKHLVALDWDGTLVENVWPRRDGIWLPGAVDAMKEMDEFAQMIIHTARIAPVMPQSGTPRSVGEIQEEINEIRKRLDSIGMRHVKIHTDPWKPGADVFVDDRAVHYPGRKQSWRNIVPKIAAMCGVSLDDR